MLKYMTLGAYIRLMMEKFEFILLSAVSEAYEFNFSDDNRRVSLGISYLFIVACLTFTIFIVYQFSATKSLVNKSNYRYSEELFAGLKENNNTRIHTLFLVIRLLILCTILICLQDQHFYFRVVLFALTQIIY